ncbi:MAG: heparan-alpha-glucosaminide N-acetyltransferase domain-containing protein [Gemmatimonadetes bacterium]|nr:heparan-alpha-glucosaminide N-acetyltransferase domain-containing protein [Gemmatimonadota bacterium]
MTDTVMPREIAAIPADVVPAVTAASNRLTQLDLLRGLVMVVMAIDHVAFFVAKRHPGEYWGVPLPEYPSAIAFFTRAITHLSAPGFFLLMGAGMALFRESRSGLGWTQGRIARYFVTRGLLLVLINQFIENPAWITGFLVANPEAFWPAIAGPGGAFTGGVLFGVLTALGLSMVIAGLVSALPSAALLASGLGAMVASQVLTPDAAQAMVQFNPLVRLINVPGVTGFVFVIYAVLPWLGVTLCGMALGRLAGNKPGSFVRIATGTGAALLVLFLAMRVGDGFGNHHSVPGLTVIDFLNVTKYPPSLTFLSLTLGINLMLLGVLPHLPATWRRVLDGYGRSPMFFYLAHIWLFMLIGLPFRNGTGYGVLYLVWVVGMVPLYFACKRYTAFKLAKPKESYWRML